LKQYCVSILPCSLSVEPRYFVPSFGDYIIQAWTSSEQTIVKTDDVTNLPRDYIATYDFYAQECPEIELKMMCAGGNPEDGECNGHGACVNRTCVCDPGWLGKSFFFFVKKK
jgi:hypothetical protein